MSCSTFVIRATGLLWLSSDRSLGQLSGKILKNKKKFSFGNCLFAHKNRYVNQNLREFMKEFNILDNLSAILSCLTKNEKISQL